MPDEKVDYFEAKREELFYTLRDWYMLALNCKGLNNDEIDAEFYELINEIEEIDDTDSNCIIEIIDKYTDLLESRTKLNPSSRDNFRVSMSIALECLSHFSKVQNYCPSCGPKFAVEDMINAHYWMGYLRGTEDERNDSGISIVVQKTTDARHLFNRERKLELTDWYRKKRNTYKSKDDAAVDAAHIFHVAHSTARKYLIGI